jgi:hypothetical protein
MARTSPRRRRRSQRQPEREGRSGSLMGMREGFKRMTGTGQRRPKARGNAFLGWIIVLVFLIVLVLWLIR